MPLPLVFREAKDTWDDGVGAMREAGMEGSGLSEGTGAREGSHFL